MERGDWLVGNTTKAEGNRLLYAMRVSEVLDFDDYFHDPRFQGKKPKRGGTWQERCGDVIAVDVSPPQTERTRPRWPSP
jgi:hypothetical protein